MMEYLKGVYKEFKRVKWPNKKTTVYFTIGVISISIFFGIYMFGLDTLFVNIIKKIIVSHSV